MKWLAISQTIAVVAAGVILPFYTVFLQQATDSYSVFAYLYGSFALAAALTHLSVGPLREKLSTRALLVGGNSLAGLTLLAVPSLHNLWQLYLVQIVMGIALALQKTGEKIAVAALTTNHNRAQLIGNYHALVAIVTALIMFVTGWLLDTFSLIFLFYIVGFWLVVAGFASFKVEVHHDIA